jgi:two-component system, NarL family, invasion response regulator UvrY
MKSMGGKEMEHRPQQFGKDSRRPAMIRVIFVDDHPVVRRGLRQLLASEPDLSVVGEASNPEEMLELLRTQDCDVLLTDISMPGRSGLDVLVELKQEHPRLPVLVLSMHPEEMYGVPALKLGAAGYLCKDGAAEDLVDAIRKVMTGRRYVSNALAERLALDLAIDSGRPLHEILSAREHQVLCLLATGMSLTHIAKQLALSIQSVSTYRARILEKTGMASNEQLIHYAISHAEISPETDPPREMSATRSRGGYDAGRVLVAMA